MDDKIMVKSHVSRDLLQSSTFFNTTPKVVWEYVSNSLDNAPEGIPVTVIVNISKDEIVIADDGSGMSRKDLQTFFTMHGENVKRKTGKRVRGRFGTGKSAAFGIAKLLTVSTRKDGKINEVSLHLDDIKQLKDGDPFSVKIIRNNEATDEQNGTIVRINEIGLSRVDIDQTISFIEKNLARYRSRAEVIINGHRCKYQEPLKVKEISVTVPQELIEIIGQPTLIIKVSPINLDREARGIDILSEGVWHETTLGDIDGKEMYERFFGEVDVPLLELVDDDIAPFDSSRSNTLNRANRRVITLIAWISQELEKERILLVKQEQEKRKTEQSLKLQKQASKIASILNEDFNNLLLEIEISKKISGQNKKVTISETETSNGEVTPGGGEEQSNWTEAGWPYGDGKRGKNPPGEGDYPRPGPNLIPGDSLGSPKKEELSGKKNRKTGIFSIEFEHLTVEYQRSKYNGDEHQIIINLDHPQVAFALKEGGGTLDSNHFLSMVYEVAAVEYAQTIPFERIRLGEAVDAPEALFVVGETIDRITRKFANILT